MDKTTLNIKGMHCRSCEILIEKHIKKIPGVTRAEVSEKKGTAEVYGNGLNTAKIEAAVRAAGYSLGKDDKLKYFSGNIKDYYDVGLSALILLLLFRLISLSGFSDLISNVSMKPSSLATVGLIGLTAGFSTCMALVGGLVLALTSSYARKNTASSFSEKLKPQLYFNAGRIVSFFLFGGLVGLIGSLFALSVTFTALLTAAVSLVMLTLGLQLTGLFPFLNQGITLPKIVARKLKIGDGTVEYSPKTAFLTGGATFFLPCGFTQAMQLYAMTSGSFLQGGLIMTAFAIGTVPGLLGIGALTSAVKGKVSSYFFKLAGVAVISLSVFNFSNALNLLGINPVFQSAGISDNAIPGDNVNFDGSVQTVKMDQLSSGYSPNKFTVYKDVPVKWIINSKDPNSCAASIYSSKLGIRKNLSEGENIFEFTPHESGQIKFSCSMGMYTGSFEVIEKGEKPSVLNQDTPEEKAGCGGGCGTGGCGGNCGKSGGCGCGKSAERQENQVTPVSASVSPVSAGVSSDVQVLTSEYTLQKDISPKDFTVESGRNIRLEVDAKDDGRGCMSTIMIPGLFEEAILLEKGKKIVMEFLAENKGDYKITCAMGVPRGTIKVI